jgi:hypothetical protein
MHACIYVRIDNNDSDADHAVCPDPMNHEYEMMAVMNVL